MHVALLEAKKKLGGEISAQDAAMITQLEQQATVIDQQTEARKELERLWENTADNIQGLMTDTFEEIYSGGITSFQDLADEIMGIFIRLAAEQTTLMLKSHPNGGSAAASSGASCAGAAGAAGGVCNGNSACRRARGDTDAVDGATACWSTTGRQRPVVWLDLALSSAIWRCAWRVFMGAPSGASLAA